MIQHHMLEMVPGRAVMPQPNEKLAASLNALRELQKAGRRVFQSQELSRVDRERLLENGFLSEVMKGWLISM